MKLVFLLTLPFTLAHMEMAEPAPRRSKHLKGVTDVDYSMTSPLGGGYSYPCRGFSSGPVSKKYSAGQTIDVAIEGGATHNGGHCQFALSFNGQDFVTIHTVMGTCLQPEKSFSVQIPKNFPSGKAVFAWVWNNRSGNRELYMNCADIEISGGSGTSYSGPELLIANFDVPGKKIHSFPEGFADDFGKDLFAAQPKITISSSGSNTYQPNTDQQNEIDAGDQQDRKGDKATPEYPTNPKETPANETSSDSKPEANNKQGSDNNMSDNPTDSSNKSQESPIRNETPSDSKPQANNKQSSDNNMPNYPADTSGDSDDAISNEIPSDEMPRANEKQGSRKKRNAPEYPQNAEPKNDKPTAIPEPSYNKQPQKPIKETTDVKKNGSGAGCNDGGSYCEGDDMIGTCFLGSVTYGQCAPGTKCQEPKTGQAQCA